MEYPFPKGRCILCLRGEDEVQITKSHLVPEFVGGFLWACTHCKDCNSFLGHEVESELKRDDSVRHAVEVALARDLPELCEGFAEGQSYVARAEDGSLIRATRREGDFQIKSETLEDGSLRQASDLARQSVGKMLERGGASEKEIGEALRRFDASEHGELVPLTESLAIKHGSVDSFDLPFDGRPVGDLFPAAVAFHLLALRLPQSIYHPLFNELRDAVRIATTDPSLFVVERARDPVGYAPYHLVGMAQTTPHLVVRVQLFGDIVWRVHLQMAASIIKPEGIVLDLKTKAASGIEPRPMSPIAYPPSP